MKKIIVTPEWVDKRLDVFLLSNLANKEVTRSMLEKQIKKNVTVNSKVAKKGYFLRLNDIVEYNEELVDMKNFVSEDIVSVKGNLDIVDENDKYIVLNKPKGVPVHPGKGHEIDTLANYLRHYLESKGEYDLTVKRGGIVHRLDMDVSGLMIVAKDRTTQLALQQMFEKGEVTKLYLATVRSLNTIVTESKLTLKKQVKTFIDNNYQPDDRWMKIEGYITRDQSDRKRMRLSFDKGKTGRFALSYILPLKKNQMLINIKTGRMHQIRATMRALGWVVANDQLYGDPFPKGKMELEEILLKIYLDGTKESVWKLV